MKLDILNKIFVLFLALLFVSCSTPAMSEKDFQNMSVEELEEFITKCKPNAEKELLNTLKNNDIDAIGNKKAGFEFSQDYLNCDRATQFAFKLQKQALRYMKNQFFENKSKDFQSPKLPQMDEKEISNEELQKSQISKSVEDNKRTNDNFYNLDPFTLNLLSDSGASYLKMQISFELNDKKDKEIIDDRIAKIRDIIIKITTSKTVKEVKSQTGKTKLAREIQQAVNKILKSNTIKSVNFTQFILQSF